MKKRQRDLLLDAAFDALRREDAQRLAKESPEAEAELRRLSAVKSAMPALRDVPECQLSVERVRDAILSRQIRPAARWTPRASWTLGSVAGVATAVWLVVLAMPEVSPTTAPSLVSAPPPSAPIARNEIMTSSGSAVPKGSVTAPAGLDAVAKERPADAPRRPVRPKRQPRATMLLASNPVPRGADIVPVAAALASDPTVTAAAAEPVSTPTDSPVIVVTDRENPATGAQQATEVSAPGDVVFGG